MEIISHLQQKRLELGIGEPRGSKYPIFEASGSKHHTVYGIWALKPQILDTWTLWEGTQKVDFAVFCLLGLLRRSIAWKSSAAPLLPDGAVVPTPYVCPLRPRIPCFVGILSVLYIYIWFHVRNLQNRKFWLVQVQYQYFVIFCNDSDRSQKEFLRRCQLRMSL